MKSSGVSEIVVISDVCGTKAGAYVTTLLLCRALQQMDHRVTCFATWVEPKSILADEKFKIVRPLMKRGYRFDWPNRCLALQAISHIRKRKPSLVIVVGVTRLCRYLIESSIADSMLIWELTNANIGNKFVDVQASKLLSRCKAMLSPSFTIDRNIRGNYKYNGVIERLPFWVEDDHSPCLYQPAELFADFIFLGRRDEEKGLRELIQATSLIRDEYPAVKVVIGGFGNEAPFASLVKSLGVEKNIFFRTFPSRQEVNNALAGSRGLVLPSYHEGYPLVLLEAAQSGLPFIATDVGSVREVFGKSSACFIVEPRDPEGLALRMKQMLSEPDDIYNARKDAALEISKKISSPARVMENLNRILQFATSQ